MVWQILISIMLSHFINWNILNLEITPVFVSQLEVYYNVDRLQLVQLLNKL